MVSRHCQPDCIVLVELFIHLHEVENPVLEMVNHAVLHCMEEGRLRDVAHNTGNMSKHVEFLVNMAPGEIDFAFFVVGITEHPS